MTTMFFLAEAATEASAAAGAEQPNILLQFFPLIIIFALLYFVMIRPQQKRQKEHSALVSGLQTGDKVITSAGIHGMIANVKDRTVIVKIAEGVKVEMDRAAIVSVDRSASSSES